ncbi:MAG TPA: hypothetical protein VN712_08200 [Dermatophilaceae bacterium]|nr:hypothetical protein [Dermatophilaceae bacterium]
MGVSGVDVQGKGVVVGAQVEAARGHLGAIDIFFANAGIVDGWLAGMRKLQRRFDSVGRAGGLP